MLRTFVTGSYKKPRQFTWFTGMVLLMVTLFLSFSGYLLPWDQLSLWAVTIGASMVEAIPPQEVGAWVNLQVRGAPQFSENGLLRFYLLHVFALPLIGLSRLCPALDWFDFYGCALLQSDCSWAFFTPRCGTNWRRHSPPCAC